MGGRIDGRDLPTPPIANAQLHVDVVDKQATVAVTQLGAHIGYPVPTECRIGDVGRVLGASPVRAGERDIERAARAIPKNPLGMSRG